MESIFREGDRVYHYLYGWGNVIKIITSNNYLWVRVQFDDKPKEFEDNFKDGFLLSFTEYKLEGFSKERPEKLPNKGDVVWVRDEDDEHWRVTHFIEKSQDSYWTSFDMQLRTLMPWKQLTTINPTKQ
jgi:hypothetical protein